MRRYLPSLNLNLSKRDWYILLAALTLLLAIPLTVTLLKRYQESRIRALANAQIVDGSVKITNIHAHGFTVSWATVGESTGVIKWSLSDQALAQTAYDDRATGTDTEKAAFTSSTHYVTLPYPPGDERQHQFFKEPSQAFDLKILSGDGKLYGGVFDGHFDVINVSEESAAITVNTGPEIKPPSGAIDGWLVWDKNGDGIWSDGDEVLKNIPAAFVSLSGPGAATIPFCPQNHAGGELFYLSGQTECPEDTTRLPEGGINTLPVGTYVLRFTAPPGWLPGTFYYTDQTQLNGNSNAPSNQAAGKVEGRDLVVTTVDISENVTTHLSVLVVKDESPPPVGARGAIDGWLVLDKDGDGVWGSGDEILKNTLADSLSLTGPANIAVPFCRQTHLNPNTGFQYRGEMFYLSGRTACPDPSPPDPEVDINAVPVGEYSLRFTAPSGYQPQGAFYTDQSEFNGNPNAPSNQAAGRIEGRDVVVDEVNISEKVTTHLSFLVVAKETTGTGVYQESLCHFSTPSQPDPDQTEAVAPGCPDPVYGTVRKAQGDAAPGAIVYLTVKDGDGQDSSGAAMPLSALANSEGRYVIDLGNARTSDLSSYFAYNRYTDDLEDIFAQGGLAGVAELFDNPTSSDEPIPDLVLNHPPVVEPVPDQEIPVGVPYDYQTIATDADADELRFSLECSAVSGECPEPPRLIIDNKTGYISWSNPAPVGTILDLTVSVTDGKSGSPVTEEFRLTVVEFPDTEAPDTQITAGPGDGEVVTQRSVKFDFTGTDNRTPTEKLSFYYMFGKAQDLGRECSVDKERWNRTLSPGSVTFGFTDDGEYRFCIAAEDEAGNIDQSPASRTFTVDTQGPVIEHTPVTSATKNQEVIIEANVKDPSGVNAVQLFYRNFNNGQPSDYVQVAMQNVEGDSWRGTIPAEIVLVPWVDYYLLAADTNGFASVSPENAPPVGEGYYRINVTAPPAVVLNRVELEPVGPVNLTVGQTQQFKATAYDTNDQEISEGVEFSWYSTGDVGSLSELPDGSRFRLFTAENNGTSVVAVTATLGEHPVSDFVEVNVSQGQLTCSIVPESFPIAPGEEQTITVTAEGGSDAGYTYSWSTGGGSFVGSTDTQTVTWRADTDAPNGAIFQITANVTDKATGVTCATAATATATIQVPSADLSYVTIDPSSRQGENSLEVGDEQLFTAQAYDANNNKVPDSDTTYEWSVIKSGSARVILSDVGKQVNFRFDESGLYSVIVVATRGSDSVNNNALISVYEALSCGDVDLSPSTVPSGGSLTASISPSGGSRIYTHKWSADGGSFPDGDDFLAVTWQAPEIGSNQETYTLSATVTDDTTKKTCTASGEATVRPQVPVLASVTIDPASWTTPNGVGDTQVFTATALDSDGNDITSQVSFSWSTGGGVGSIAPSGSTATFTAESPGGGSIDVAATLGEATKNDSAQVTVKDNIPPSAITDLTVTSSSQTSLDLRWTAPGDDGDTGTASGYDLRCATETITDANWESAQQAVGEPTPQTAGSTETFTFTGLNPGTAYYCAVKSVDNEVPPNWSGLSNVAQGTTQEAAPTTATLNISLKMQGRPDYLADPRGSRGTVNIFARRPGEDSKLWEVNDLSVNAEGKATNVELHNLSAGETYEFLLKGYIHLQKKLVHTLVEGVNNLDFGTLLAGDVNRTRDNQVNSLDNDVVLTEIVESWDSAQACADNPLDCRLGDFNLDSVTNSLDYDIIFTNWGTNGD